MRASLIALLVTLVAGACLAQDAKPRKGGDRPNPYLQKMDKDGDGQVSKEEYRGFPGTFEKLDADEDGKLGVEELRRIGSVMQQMMWDSIDREALFKSLDANEDGNITLEELRAAPLGELLVQQQESARKAMGAKAATQGFVRKFDKNGDGTLSRDELPEEKVKGFDKVDANGDGILDAEELAAMQKRQGKPGAQGGGKGGIIGKFDKDSDGKISREEFPPEKIEHFDRIDANGDGQIDEGELGGRGKGGKKPRPDQPAPKGKRPANF